MKDRTKKTNFEFNQISVYDLELLQYELQSKVRYMPCFSLFEIIEQHHFW